MGLDEFEIGEPVVKHDKFSNEQNSESNEAGEVEEPESVGGAIRRSLRELKEPFVAFVNAPKEIIGVNLVNIFEGMAYFGVLTLLVLFLTKNVSLSDVSASFVVGTFLALITFSQLFLSIFSDIVGPKKMLGIAILVLLASRALLGFSEFIFGSLGTGLGSPMFFAVCCALFLAALAYGVFNPSVYSITRMYSDEKTSAVSYATLYAGMNLGAFIVGLCLPHIRRVAGDEFGEDGALISEGLLPGTNGYSGAFIFLAAIMVIVAILYFIFIFRSKSRPVENPKEEQNAEETESEVKKLSARERLVNFLKSLPFADLKFDFFIFILIPVQTLFAYQNILIPAYLERCFRDFPTISNNFETFSNLNPLIVFICAPIIAALTAKQSVYKMMIIGTAIMALPTFLLCLGQTPALFLTFVFIGSIGESIWQPRFLQHVTQIAPKERMGVYVGVANLPWFMTKLIVAFYVGFFMQAYIPDPATGLEQNPTLMWLIFAFIANVTPVALFFARNWAGKSEKNQSVVHNSDGSETNEMQ